MEELLQKGLIHKAVNNLPETYEALEKLVEPFFNDGVIVVVDDGLSQMRKYLPQVFEEFTSKMNTTMIFVSQASFVDSDDFRRMSDNSHYIICTLNKRNPRKIKTLALQSKPCNHKFVINSYLDATRMKTLSTPYPNNRGYGYFILDFHLESPGILEYKTNIFPSEIEPVTVYQERM